MKTGGRLAAGRARGFTLIELAAGMAITGLLLTGITMAIASLQETPRRSIDTISVQNQFRSATALIREDAANAQSFQAGTGTEYGTFRWVNLSSFPPTKNRVVYFFEDNTLVRQRYADDAPEPPLGLVHNVTSQGDVAFTVQTSPNPSVPSATERFLTVTMTVFTEDSDSTPVPNSTTVRVSLRPEQSEQPTEYRFYYLHNRPTPPTGDTVSQTDLPMDSARPSATTLFNYDTNRDSRPGLRLIRSNNQQETDNRRHQDWVSDALAQPMVIKGQINFYLIGAAANFQANRTMNINSILQDYNPATDTYTVIDGSAVGRFVSTSSWVTLVTHTSPVTYTVAAGHKLVVTVRYESTSGADGMIAYDTTLYPAVAAVPSQP